MIALLLVGFVAGVVTGFTPCILPVVPVIVAGGASGERRSPFLIIAGLVTGFALIVLVSASLLSLLHLPQDFLEKLGIVLLVVVGIGLLVPRVGELLERPFARLGGRQVTGAGGFVLGVSLGFVFVPCAGPVLTAITTVAARNQIGLTLVLLTLAFALGVSVPLFVLAVVAQRTATGWKALRAHLPTVRKVAGAVVIVMAVAIFFNWTRPLTNVSLPGVTSIDNSLGASGSVHSRLQTLRGEQDNTLQARLARDAGYLPDLAPAPNFTGITAWLNTPGDRPLSLTRLRGKVVLVDFWTYSCINCERSLPHVEAWYARYHADGLEVVGVHSPEFPFEHVVSNVKAAAAQLGVDYPIAVDDNLDTWNAYDNEYWPAEYLIDQNGEIRYTSFGEGDYTKTEDAIRALLSANVTRPLPPPTDVANRTPAEATTPESYLGYLRIDNQVGTAIVNDKPVDYAAPSSVPANALAFNGTWTVHQWEATAGADATIELNFEADDVYLVLGGTGTVTVSVDGTPDKTLAVSGVPDLYTLVSGSTERHGLLTLTASPGVMAYDFTFG